MVSCQNLFRLWNESSGRKGYTSIFIQNEGRVFPAISVYDINKKVTVPCICGVPLETPQLVLLPVYEPEKQPLLIRYTGEKSCIGMNGALII